MTCFYFSENKGYLEEHRNLLERQDQKVKNVLQMCMRTIKEMKSETVVLFILLKTYLIYLIIDLINRYYYIIFQYIEREHVPQHSSNPNGLSRVVNARTEESSYESDSEV